MKLDTFVSSIFLFFVFLCVSVLLSGCVVESSPYGAAQIVSDPPGAEVVNTQDGSTLGTTPLEHVWETEEGKSEYFMFNVSKPGYEDKITAFFVNPRYDSEDSALENPQKIEVSLQKVK